MLAGFDYYINHMQQQSHPNIHDMRTVRGLISLKTTTTIFRKIIKKRNDPGKVGSCCELQGAILYIIDCKDYFNEIA